MSEANKLITTKVIEAIGSGDVETLKSLITKDIAVITAGTAIFAQSGQGDKLYSSAPDGLRQMP